MPWVRLEDTFPSHSKIARLTDRAFRLWVCALAWSVANLTDGKIPPRSDRIAWLHISASTGKTNTPPAVVAEVVTVGLWTTADDGSYLIHDFLRYQPSKAQVEKEREANRERARRARGHGDSHGVTPDERADRVTPPLRQPERTSGRTSVTQQQAKPLPTTPNGKVPVVVEADPECYEAWLIEARRLNKLKPGKIGNPRGWARTLALTGKWPDEPEPEPPDQTPEYMR